ncbi:MAG: S8 family serine peptidase [Luteolibacter sp.]|uniref:S8 family peptidase n=1 Tax=Luteolibacter sp. TaxID=1962973 RepID=UPI0032660B9A
MKPYFRHLLAALIVVICGLFGWWIVRDLRESVSRRVVVRPSAEPQARIAPHTVARSKPSVRDEFHDGTTVEIFGSRQPDEVILRFPSDESFSAFLFAAGQSNIEVVDQLDRLRAVRLRYDDREDLTLLLMGENITTYDSVPSAPSPGPVNGSAQDGLVGFGNGLLPWLGITSDHSKWGAGVKIAVLDSGIVPHPDLPGLVKSIEIVPFPQDINKTHGHGTAVASLIAGVDASAPGVAPAAQLISIRISDESGQADSFAMAAGILAAVDSGADLINISMGTSVDNPLIAEAVIYAQNHHALIVASSGNSEQSDSTYPAAYPSVISVGSVDARGEHLDFSNYGTFLSVTAPGYAVNAAWPGNRYTRISGTSASAPIVTGAIAATMSNGTGVKMSASQAAEIVMKYSDEAGISGPDSEYGAGILNVGRIMTRAISGIVDAAITDQRIVATGAGDQIQITIQNRGTAILVNTLLEISTPFGNRQFNATTLAPGAVQTFTMPVLLNGIPKDSPIEVNSKLTLGTIGRDITPYNNQRSDSLYLR